MAAPVASSAPSPVIHQRPLRRCRRLRLRAKNPRSLVLFLSVFSSVLRTRRQRGVQAPWKHKRAQAHMLFPNSAP